MVRQIILVRICELGKLLNSTLVLQCSLTTKGAIAGLECGKTFFQTWSGALEMCTLVEGDLFTEQDPADVRITTLLKELAPIVGLLVERKGWTRERAEEAMDGYGQYLKLLQLHFDVMLVPSEDIDEVWHNHILWTERYGGDCHDVFGRFLHHYPCFDTSDPSERDEQYRSRETTKRLFIEEFGEVHPSYGRGAGSGVSDDQANTARSVIPGGKGPPCGGCNCHQR